MDERQLRDTIIRTVKLRMENQWDQAHGQMADPQLDAYIASYADEIMKRVKHYIHADDLPAALCDVLAAMTCDLLRCENQYSKDMHASRLQSISLGDAQIAMDAPNMNIYNAAEGIVRAYKSDLHYYRRMAR
jgi:hypothetical protein